MHRLVTPSSSNWARSLFEVGILYHDMEYSYYTTHVSCHCLSYYVVTVVIVINFLCNEVTKVIAIARCSTNFVPKQRKVQAAHHRVRRVLE